MGGKSVTDDDEEVEKMRAFGGLLGMAFQIKDDLFDYGETKIGKPTGIDIKEKKMTLPLIYTINNASSKEKKWLINSVKNHNTNKKRVKEVIQLVKDTGGLDYAQKRMENFRKEALDILMTFPKNSYRDSLELMVNYVIIRKQ